MDGSLGCGARRQTKQNNSRARSPFADRIGQRLQRGALQLLIGARDIAGDRDRHVFCSAASTAPLHEAGATLAHVDCGHSTGRARPRQSCSAKPRVSWAVRMRTQSSGPGP